MPQKGNPHRLTVKQHILPTKSMYRFSDATGGVDTFLVKQQKCVRLKPTNGLFTYTRRWDQKAENHLKEIEDAFQNVAEKIIIRNCTNLKLAEIKIVTEFFLSWWARANLTEIEDQIIKGIIGPSHSLSIDEHEQLEAAGILTIRDDSSIAGNRMAWMLIRMRMDREHESGAYKNWGLLSTADYEFGFADHPVIPAIPLTPKQILFLNVRDQDIQVQSLHNYNMKVAKAARLFFAGRNLIKCIGFQQK